MEILPRPTPTNARLCFQRFVPRSKKWPSRKRSATSTINQTECRNVRGRGDGAIVAEPTIRDTLVGFTSPEYRKTTPFRIIVLAGGAVQRYDFRRNTGVAHDPRMPFDLRNPCVRQPRFRSGSDADNSRWFPRRQRSDGNHRRTGQSETNLDVPGLHPEILSQQHGRRL